MPARVPGKGGGRDHVEEQVLRPLPTQGDAHFVRQAQAKEGTPVKVPGKGGGERAPVQEPRRSGRVRKVNVSYNPDTWDSARD